VDGSQLPVPMGSSIRASAWLVKGYNSLELLTEQRLQNVRGTWLQGALTSFSQGRLYWAKRPWYHNPFMTPARPAHAANCPVQYRPETPDLCFSSSSCRSPPSSWSSS
jgi:hypothetical protein